MRRLTTREWWKFVPVLREREPFCTGGALRGQRWLGADCGMLPLELWGRLCDLDFDMRVAYVVYSYNTPIAWCDVDGNWTVPDERYSVTTTRHQNLIATAVSVIDDMSYA